MPARELISDNTTTAPLVSLKGLVPGYTDGKKKTAVFAALSMALHPAELICFMGANGAGKSTLLRTIAGLQPALEGKIDFGEALRDRPLFENVSVVLTDPIQAGNMTVSELITYGRYPYLGWNLRLDDKDHEIIYSAIKRVSIQHLVEKKLTELSDGQRQMVLIARALAQETPVLLLDEPTSHLDLNNRVGIMRFLKELARTSGKAILVATHELDLALQTADVLWLARPDKTILTGVPEDLVLSGALDEVFQLKGYDLKTGKINQEPHNGIEILLEGEGHEYQWTKNALERSGFSISRNSGKRVTITIDPSLRWGVDGIEYVSLEALLGALK